MPLKIGKPVRECPYEGSGRGRFDGVREAARKLKDGEWLPVQCDDIREAQLARNSLMYNAKRLNDKTRFRCSLRGNTVYVQEIRDPQCLTSPTSNPCSEPPIR